MQQFLFIFINVVRHDEVRVIVFLPLTCVHVFWIYEKKTEDSTCVVIFMVRSESK